jgi:hypothetical protein
MNSKILDRYDITSDNRFIIDVNIPEPDELFETYDENASLIKIYQALKTRWLISSIEEVKPKWD